MNERLSKEIERYEEENHGFEGSSRYDCICIAQHFYNFALEGVKVVVYKLIDEYLEMHDSGHGIVNVNTVLEDLINIRDCIDNLTK